MRSSCLANHVTPATPVTETKNCLYISHHTPLFGALDWFRCIGWGLSPGAPEIKFPFCLCITVVDLFALSVGSEIRARCITGISLSVNWSDFFILRFAYIPFVTHRDEYRVMRGSAVLTFIKIRCFTEMYKKGTSSSGHEWDLLTFYDPFFLITKKLISSKGVFS